MATLNAEDKAVLDHMIEASTAASGVPVVVRDPATIAAIGVLVSAAT